MHVPHSAGPTLVPALIVWGGVSAAEALTDGTMQIVASLGAVGAAILIGIRLWRVMERAQKFSVDTSATSVEGLQAQLAAERAAHATQLLAEREHSARLRAEVERLTAHLDRNETNDPPADKPVDTETDEA